MATFSVRNLLRGNLGKTMFGKNKQSTGTNLGFPRTLNKAELWAVTGSDITCAADTWVRVGQTSIPAQQVWHLGQSVRAQSPLGLLGLVWQTLPRICNITLWKNEAKI